MTAPRPLSRFLAASLVLLGCAGVVAAHLLVLHTSGQDPIRTPVSALSRTSGGALHGVGLSLFALAHVALAVLLHRARAGWTTRAGQLLLLVDAALLLYVARYFATASEATLYGPDANDPLSLLASGTGLAMALLAPGLLRSHRRAGWWNIACLVVWLALVPLILAVDASWLGAYERLVGTVFVAWVTGLAALVGFTAPRPPP